MDLIDRAAVLKAIDDYERLSAVSQTVRNMTSLREIVQGLPAVQPEKRTNKRTETHACDCIERQSAIEALESIGSLDTEADKKYARSVFEALPSVQPQPIVRCKDCKYADEDVVCQNDKGLAIQDDDDFCSFAERRTE